MTTESTTQARAATELKAAAHKTPAELRREATTIRQPPSEPSERVHIWFSMMEVDNVSGIGHMTIRYWIKRGWLKPARRIVRRAYKFSAWQLVGLCVLAAIHNDVRKNEKSYLDRATIRALANLAEQDDALLLSPNVQDGRDMGIAERAAAAASAAAGLDGMTPEMTQNLARALSAIDAKYRNLVGH
jgi:DNA-binding transcriptional MerR regulator